MPNLTLTVTTAQAARISAALKAKYAGSPLESAPLAEQAATFFLKTARQMVLEYERNRAYDQAIAAAALVSEL